MNTGDSNNGTSSLLLAIVQGQNGEFFRKLYEAYQEQTRRSIRSSTYASTSLVTFQNERYVVSELFKNSANPLTVTQCREIVEGVEKYVELLGRYGFSISAPLFQVLATEPTTTPGTGYLIFANKYLGQDYEMCFRSLKRNQQSWAKIYFREIAEEILRFYLKGSEYWCTRMELEAGIDSKLANFIRIPDCKSEADAGAIPVYIDFLPYFVRPIVHFPQLEPGTRGYDISYDRIYRVTGVLLALFGSVSIVRPRFLTTCMQELLVILEEYGLDDLLAFFNHHPVYRLMQASSPEEKESIIAQHDVWKDPYTSRIFAGYIVEQVHEQNEYAKTLLHVGTDIVYSLTAWFLPWTEEEVRLTSQVLVHMLKRQPLDQYWYTFKKREIEWSSSFDE